MRKLPVALFFLLALASCGGPGVSGSTAESLPGGNSGPGASTPSVETPPLDHIVVHFSFDENANGDIVETMGVLPAIHPSYVLETSPTLEEKERMPFKEGIVGEAMLFDGYSSFGEVSGYDFAPGGDEFSISVWLAPRTYNYTDKNAQDINLIQGIVSQYFKSGSISSGFTLGYAREGKLAFGVGTNNGWYEIWDTFDPLIQYQWNHVAATFDGPEGKMSLYLNGLLVGSATLPAGSTIQVNHDSDFYIGRNSVVSSDAGCSKGVHAGLLDELYITRDVLTPAEVRALNAVGTVDGEKKELPLQDVYLQNDLGNDLYRPQFHTGPLEHWMNEPHAPFYYNGLYHLFYQSNPNGPYFNGAQGINWGHLTSPDLVNWTNHKEVIQPTNGTIAPDGLWSGGSLIAKDGTPVLLLTCGDYSHPGMISNQNIGLAFPKDLSDPYLREWEISDRLAIEQVGGQGRAGEFRDANVYQDGDDYYLLVCSGDESSGRGTALIYHTNANKEDYLYNWEYKGHVFDYANNDAKYGSSWELPCLQPLLDQNGNPSGKFVLVISPAPASTADNNIIYWIGDFNKETCRFVPDFPDPRRMDYGRNVFTGPSMFVDPNGGKAYIFSIMQSQRDATTMAASGWSHNVGLVRELYYDTERADLGIRFGGDWSSLEGETLYEASDVRVSSVNAALSAFDSDMYRLRLSISNLSSDFVIRLRKSLGGEEATVVSLTGAGTSCSIDTNLNRGNGGTSAGGLASGALVREGTTTVEIFVDRSMIEALFNGQKTISARSYPGDLHANGLDITSDPNQLIDQIEIVSIGSTFKEVV